MANYQKKKIQDTDGSKFGQYKEEVGGGGSPQQKDPNKRAPGVNSDYRKSNNDTMQPRTDDGKFTYKSVNGKSIDPKYGPSRGKTVNPLLTGGENGVMIDDTFDKNGNVKPGVASQFANESGVYWNKYKDSWYQKGSEIVTGGDFKVRVSAETIWNVAKGIYNELTGEFGGNISFQHQLGNGGVKSGSGFGGGEEGKNFDQTKKGRHSQEELAAQQRAKASNSEQGVINQSTGGLKLKPGTPKPVIPPPTQRPQPQPGANVGTTPVAPTTGGATGIQPSTNVSTASASDITNADYTPKYSDDDISQARSVLQQAGFSDDELNDFDSLSPKEKDDYIDKYFSVADDDTTGDGSSDNNAQPTPSADNSSSEDNKEEEEDSEAVKKIKKMGFDE